MQQNLDSIVDFKRVNKSYDFAKHLLTKDESELKVIILFTNAEQDAQSVFSYYQEVDDLYSHYNVITKCVSAHHNPWRQVYFFNRLVSEIEDNQKLLYFTNELALLENGIVRPDCCMVVNGLDNGTSMVKARPFDVACMENIRKELRYPHNLLKMYLSGAFDW